MAPERKERPRRVRKARNNNNEISGSQDTGVQHRNQAPRETRHRGDAAPLTKAYKAWSETVLQKRQLAGNPRLSPQEALQVFWTKRDAVLARETTTHGNLCVRHYLNEYEKEIRIHGSPLPIFAAWNLYKRALAQIKVCQSAPVQGPIQLPVDQQPASLDQYADMQGTQDFVLDRGIDANVAAGNPEDPSTLGLADTDIEMDHSSFAPADTNFGADPGIETSVAAGSLEEPPTIGQGDANFELDPLLFGPADTNFEADQGIETTVAAGSLEDPPALGQADTSFQLDPMLFQNNDMSVAARGLKDLSITGKTYTDADMEFLQYITGGRFD